MKHSTKSSKALWGGRFSQAPAKLLESFSQSVSFDWRLYRQDIRGSIAHATMLKRIGIITSGELKSIVVGLKKIESEIDSGKFTWSREREDVHMNIEATLTSRVPAGAKLHTGRSRNDQVATDMRLWVRDTIENNRLALKNLQQALVSWAERDSSVVIPGYTHLQRAQPVLLAHHLLAYVEMLSRDDGRLQDTARRLNVLPLGSGAIAGSTLPLDREFVARELGFDEVSRNSMDAVSDRDFIVEYLFAASLIGVHLSRLAEDLILWSSAEFGFIRLPDAYTTGSSLMPQKKNPDVAELTRGKSARLIGNLMSLLTLLKGLPMTYNRDLQEDKERLFDSADTLQACLEINAAMLDGVIVREPVCSAAAADPLLLATDAADWLVRAGVPFRHAHEIVGKAVALAEKKQIPISELTTDDWITLDHRAKAGIRSVFCVTKALQSRPMTGAPHPKSVKGEIARWKRLLR